MKQMDVTKKKIGHTYFYITPFPAFTAARVSGQLSNLLAPMLGSLTPLLTDSGTDDIMKTDLEELLPVLADALGQLSGDQFEELAKALLVDYKNVAYDNEDGDTERLTYEAANELFCADLMGMILLGVEVVKVNYSGFFEKLLGQFGNPQDATAKAAVKIGTKSGGRST